MITTGEGDRATGIVYRDDAAAASPATHVMIVGVGTFLSADIADVTSPPVSARAVADWFVNDPAGFRNPARPLGSVALALSEAAPGPATFAGATVPRATFDNVKASVQGWIRRCNSHKDNMMVLFVASHGESHGRRTAFLLEDFGQNDVDVTSGMTEVEQLIGALENALPTSQLLLVDCCRGPTPVDLPWDAPFGTQLLSLARKSDDHGEVRRQWALCSTALGEEAMGRKDKTTLFTECLLAAMGGIASDPGSRDWPVKPGALLDRVTQLLRLHARPEESFQTPAGRAAGTFDITYSGSQPAKAYISLHDREAWPATRISVRDGETLLASREGIAGEPAFAVVDLQEMRPVTVSAERFGRPAGSEVITPRAPVTFVELGATTPVSVDRQVLKSLTRGTELKLVVRGDVPADDSLVLSVTKRDALVPDLRKLVLGTGQSESMEVDPGDYTVEVAFPDGFVVTRDIDIRPDHNVTLTAAQPPRSNDGLGYASMDAAVRSGALLRGVTKGPLASNPPPRGDIWALRGGISIEEALSKTFDALGRGELLPPVPDRLSGFGRFSNVELPVTGVPWTMGERFPPAWAIVSFDDHYEAVAFPAVVPAEPGRPEWSTALVVDHAAGAQGFAAKAEVVSRRWAGLLGYLASRDFERGDEVLNSMMQRGEIHDAIQSKRGNPLAAMAGALVAVAGGRAEEFPVLWLENLTNWFPELPDGPVVLARRLLGRKSPDLERVSQLLSEGYRRGIPLFSLSCDWLARGFDAVAGNDADATVMADRARQLSGRIDARQAFTVVRLAHHAPKE